jgi:hypothetical protein
MITNGLQAINLVDNSSGICGVMLLLLGIGPWGILPLLLRFPHEGKRRTVFRGMPAAVRLLRLVNMAAPIATMSMLR